jgi:hypothetical protein
MSGPPRAGVGRPPAAPAPGRARPATPGWPARPAPGKVTGEATAGRRAPRPQATRFMMARGPDNRPSGVFCRRAVSADIGGRKTAPRALLTGAGLW